MGIAIPDYAMTDRMSGERFRTFQARRPDHERWELIAGIPMMMPPPTLIHNHIAGNLALPSFGLQCPLSALYHGTPLLPRVA